jgi:S-formylglutathione hydrolase
MPARPEIVSRHRCFGGEVGYYKHESEVCGGPMRFSLFLPPQAASRAVPVLYYLAGLTCTEETFMIKAGAQRLAAELGLMLVAPDTSPRETGYPGETQAWDFGAGAGFYVDATVAPWARRYRMYSYVTRELPLLLRTSFPVRAERQGIFGHSMGGHGALVCAFRNPGQYASLSAFAPIANPMRCPWGEKAFAGYLGPDRSAWAAYDACELLPQTKTRLPLLLDQGLADQFLTTQLFPERLEAIAGKAGYPLEVRRHAGYDHGYYFISSFLADHLAHHAEALNA